MQATDRLQLREADDADIPEVQRILRAANEPFRDALGAGAFEPYLQMALAVDDRRSVATVIVAEAGAVAVGTVTYFPDAVAEGWGCPAGHAGIRSMAVHPDARRRGVGEALLAECHRRAVAEGARGVILHTAFFLEDAVRLYERYGFVRDPQHDVRASDVMELASPALDYVGMAYRLDLSR